MDVVLCEFSILGLLFIVIIPSTNLQKQPVESVARICSLIYQMIKVIGNWKYNFNALWKVKSSLAP